MAASPPASDKTITDTTKTVIESNKEVAAEAEEEAKGRHKDSVKATEKAGADVVEAVSAVGKAVATPPVVNVTVPPIVIPPIVIPGSLFSGLKDSLKNIGTTILAVPKAL